MRKTKGPIGLVIAAVVLTIGSAGAASAQSGTKCTTAIGFRLVDGSNELVGNLRDGMTVRESLVGKRVNIVPILTSQCARLVKSIAYGLTGQVVRTKSPYAVFDKAVSLKRAKYRVKAVAKGASGSSVGAGAILFRVVGDPIGGGATKPPTKPPTKPVRPTNPGANDPLPDDPPNNGNVGNDALDDDPILGDPGDDAAPNLEDNLGNDLGNNGGAIGNVEAPANNATDNGPGGRIEAEGGRPAPKGPYTPDEAPAKKTGVDLGVAGIKPPASIKLGRPVTLVISVKNNGTKSFSAKKVTSVLRIGSGAKAREYSTTATLALAAGASKAISFTGITISSSDISFDGKVDSENGVPEDNERNNVFSGAFGAGGETGAPQTGATKSGVRTAFGLRALTLLEKEAKDRPRGSARLLSANVTELLAPGALADARLLQRYVEHEEIALVLLLSPPQNASRAKRYRLVRKASSLFKRGSGIQVTPVL